MLTLLKSVAHWEFFAECGRLLLLSTAVSYVGVNVRRLALNYGWDRHLLCLACFFGAARRRQAGPRRWLWLSIGSGGGIAVAIVLLASWAGL